MDNPFSIFKRYRVDFKDEEMEKAYQTKCLRMMKPFKILNVLFWLFVCWVIMEVILQILTAIGINDTITTSPWFLLGDSAMAFLMKTLYLLENKWPKYHNIIGSISLLLFAIAFEILILLFGINGAYIICCAYQILDLIIIIEYISSFTLAVIIQVTSNIYYLIRIYLYYNNYIDSEIYIYAIICITFLLIFAEFGLIRWSKVIFQETFNKNKLEKNWKMAMDILPNGIAIIKGNSVVYHNTKTLQLLDIGAELAANEQSTKTVEIISNLLELPSEHPSQIAGNTIELLSDDHVEETLHNLGNKVISLSKKTIYFEEWNCHLIVLNDMSLMRDLEESKIRMKYKGMLMATITHDMRSPVNSVLGMLLIMKEYIPHDKIKCLQIANSSCNMLLHLIHDILDYSKIENNQIILNLELFDVTEAIDEVIDMLIFQLEEKGLQFILKRKTKERRIYGDKKRLQQILINLLSNALKFTSEGHIKLIFKEKENYLHFSVSDTGIGIKEENIPTLFKPFGMIHETKDINKYGSGLGLFLCKNLCELMGGKIRMRSKFGKGTKFSFSILGNTQESIMSESQMENIEEGYLHRYSTTNENLFTINQNTQESLMYHIPKRKILIVDDDPFNVFTMSKLMERFDIPTDSASNGEKAVAMIKKDINEYGMIFMDCNMPVLDGLQASRQIKKLITTQLIDPGYELNIVGLTGNEGEEIESKGKDAGMIELCTKPISFEKLEKIINLYYIGY